MRSTAKPLNRRRRPRRRIRATVGDLVAAAYDVVGPRGGTAEVARLLAASVVARSTSPRVRFG